MKKHLLIAFCCFPLFLSAQQSIQKPAAQQMLNKSSHNFFIENKGQWPKEVRYMAKIGGMNAWITNKGVVYDYYQITRNYKPEETMKLPRNEKEEFERQHSSMKGHVIDMVLEGANTEAKSVPTGMQESYYNYFIGNDSTKWASFVRLYSEVMIHDIYPGIDIRYYFDNNLIRYDYIAKPGADLSQINLKINGSNGYSINEIGELTLKTSLGKITHGKLFAYQNIGNRKTKIACSFIKNRNGKIGVSAENYDPALALVIDPLVYSTFIGGDFQEQGNSIVIDRLGNSYLTGFTFSKNFPTTTGAYDMTYNGVNFYFDIFVSKMNNIGTALVFSTYIGGNTDDYGNSLVIDSIGNIFITGYTNSNNYPTTSGAFDESYNLGYSGSYDAIVAKLNPSGSNLIYSTYIGGNDNDRGNSIVINKNGNAYISGNTESSNYPTTSGAFDTSWNGRNSNMWGDVFVTQLNASGTGLVYSTYIGGSGDEKAYSMDIDGNSNTFITGRVYSINYPTTTGAYDVTLNTNGDLFVTKLNASGTALIYSTLIGGNGGEDCNAIKIDSSGNAFITGFTSSSDYPTTTGAFDVIYNNYDLFVTKINATGTALIFSTYIGGNGYEEGYSIAIDRSGNSFITGLASPGYPTTTGAYKTSSKYGGAFVTELNSIGTALVYSTYICGSNGDRGYSIAIDSFGNAFINGYTESIDYPTTIGAYDESYNGTGSDVFVTKIRLSAQATNINFSNINTSSATIKWTKGGDTKRAVFVKQDTIGRVFPITNTTYTANNTFGSGSQVGTSGWYCIYNDTGRTVNVSGLTPNNYYKVMVCEYNGIIGKELYNTDSVVNNPRFFKTLITSPSTQASNVIFSNYALNSFTASWTIGNGASRAVFVCAGNSGITSPSNNVTYIANTTFGAGSQIGSSGWYCVYNGKGNTVNISGLTANTTYRLMVCEYNGVAASEIYNTNSATLNPLNYYPKPTTQASGILFSSLTDNSMTISWTKGNGANRAVFVVLGNTGTVSPINTTTYTANTIFGSGTQVGSTGWYCVYNDTGSSVTISNLQSNTTFRVMVCEYNGTPGSEVYNITTITNNPNNATTLPATPTIQASNITFSIIAPKTFTATCTKGNGTKRAIFIKSASSGSALPVNNTTYTANTVFGSGTQIGTSGWYCVYNDTGRTVNISGLQQNTNYTIMACEYNGTAGSELYNTTTATNNPNSTKTTVGINEKQISKINIYPNPTNGQFVIENAKGYRLIIINSLGETIYTSTVTDNSYTADLKNVSDGVYFLKLEKEGRVFSEEIVLRR
jgi:hypothetical protein